VRHFAQALEEENRLHAFVTGYVYQPSQRLERSCLLADRILHTRLLPALRRRSLAGVRADRCRRIPVREALYVVGRRLPLVSKLQSFRHHWNQHAWVDRFSAKHVLNTNTRLVVGREDGALYSFRRAKGLDAQTIYDLPTAHYTTVRRILEREEAEFPDVCTRPGVQDALTPAQLEHKDAELSCADHVIVGSAFVKQSLTEAGFPERQVTVLPSACQADWLPSSSPRINPNGCVVLHVGYLSLRKGTHRLLRVWKRLKAYRTHRLRLIGDMHLSPGFLRDFQGCFEHVPRLPREQLKVHYASADVFALPAAAEGFAGVILEALSFGVPIIASRSSGAEGFLEQGKEALLHDFGNEDQLCADLDWMLSHSAERAEMARQAQAKAMSWTWTDYRRRFVEIVNDLERA
jgi:glycosyltransferase involved in cell wall biosynthesis